jgi:predicted nucleic acid-binding protein
LLCRNYRAGRASVGLLRESRAVWLDRVPDAVLVVTGTLKARQRISLADAIIAAFAAVAGATLVHKDPEYESLVDVVRQEHLPDKAKRPW